MNDSWTLLYGNRFAQLYSTAIGHMVLKTTNSAGILIYIRNRDALLLIRQPREAMISATNPEGMLLETPAGRFDVDLGPKALMVKEVLEETGVTITEDQITLLNFGRPLAKSAGVMTEVQYLGYAEVDDIEDMPKDTVFGVKDEHEIIGRAITAVDAIDTMPMECLATAYLVAWFQKEVALGHIIRNRGEEQDK